VRQKKPAARCLDHCSLLTPPLRLVDRRQLEGLVFSMLDYDVADSTPNKSALHHVAVSRRLLVVFFSITYHHKNTD